MARRMILALLLVQAACSRERPMPPRGAAARTAAYDAWRRPRELVAALGLRPGARVADVGAGDGYLTTHLVAAVGPTGRVIATDVDLGALWQLARRCPQAEPRVVPAADPSLEAGAYDLVLLAEVDQALPDRAAYFGKLAAALAPGGRLAVSNKLTYRDAVRDAAARAGFVEDGQPAVELPGQFLLVFRKAAS